MITSLSSLTVAFSHRQPSRRVVPRIGLHMTSAVWCHWNQRLPYIGGWAEAPRRRQRDAEGEEGWEIGRGVSPPIQQRGLRERRKLPSWVPEPRPKLNFAQSECKRSHLVPDIALYAVVRGIKNLLCIFYAKCNEKAKWWKSTIHTFDRQTDGQTERHTDRILIARPRLHSMQRDKKQVSNGLQFATYKPP